MHGHKKGLFDFLWGCPHRKISGIAQAMGRKGWSVDVWFDEMSNELKIGRKEEEEVE